MKLPSSNKPLCFKALVNISPKRVGFFPLCFILSLDYCMPPVKQLMWPGYSIFGQMTFTSQWSEV